MEEVALLVRVRIEAAHRDVEEARPDVGADGRGDVLQVAREPHPGDGRVVGLVERRAVDERVVGVVVAVAVEQEGLDLARVRDPVANFVVVLDVVEGRDARLPGLHHLREEGRAPCEALAVELLDRALLQERLALGGEGNSSTAWARRLVRPERNVDSARRRA